MRNIVMAAMAAAFTLTCGSAAMAQGLPMVVINEDDKKVEEAPPHGRIGMSTAYRITDGVPERDMEFRRRILHPGAAIGIHPINHDEVYYVVSGTGIVESDGKTETLTTGMTAYLYKGAHVGIKQVGEEPLSLIISYPITKKN